MAFKETILFLLLVETHAVISTEDNVIFSRSFHFKPGENKQLIGYSVRRFDSPSLLSCNQQCVKNAWCSSTNFKFASKKVGEGTCELNKHDISDVNENINFVDQKGVTFSLLLEDCPLGWVFYGRSCYLLIDTPTPKWKDARTVCQTHRADLPIIRSADENNFMLSLVTNQPKGKDHGTWLGLYRKLDSKFYWLDDTPLVGQFSAWADGEPNNKAEKCVNIFTKGERGGQWNDCFCETDTGKYKAPVVLCQKNLM